MSILLYDRALDRWAPGAHIGTFRGNPLAFAAGVAALDVMRRDDVLGNVRVRSAELAEGLQRLATGTRWVAEVHATGLLLGTRPSSRAQCRRRPCARAAALKWVVDMTAPFVSCHR